MYVGRNGVAELDWADVVDEGSAVVTVGVATGTTDGGASLPQAKTIVAASAAKMTRKVWAPSLTGVGMGF